jgi:hypothetical protein
MEEAEVAEVDGSSMMVVLVHEEVHGAAMMHGEVDGAAMTVVLVRPSRNEKRNNYHR